MKKNLRTGAAQQRRISLRLRTEADYEKLKESSMRLINTLDYLADDIDHLKRWDANMAERTVRYIVEEGAVKGEVVLWGEKPIFGPSSQGQNSEEIEEIEIEKEIERIEKDIEELEIEKDIWTLIYELQKN